MMDACHSGEVDKDEIIATNDNKVTLADGKRGDLKTYNYRGVKLSKKDQMSLSNSFELMQELFANLNKGSGTQVISAAAGVGFALESAEWNNGVFTYAVISGLRDKKADANKDNKVSVSELREYILREVEILTKGAQRPTTRQENIGFDFVVF
ncbi:MAG: hypothetical protein V2A54_07640 [Bacteroidota bacterium]